MRFGLVKNAVKHDNLKVAREALPVAKKNCPYCRDPDLLAREKEEEKEKEVSYIRMRPLAKT